MRIIAVDPGKNTGVCVVEPQLNSLWWVLTSGTPLEMVGYVEDCLKTYGVCVVIVERFTVTSVKHTRQYDALEVIGALRYLAHREGAVFELQSRSDRLRARAVARQFAHPADDDQESALQHAVLAAVRHGLIRDVAARVKMDVD